ncbi:hypothetical protein COL154_013867 [Colletotrichum chrysophilum]|nr:hypothetical protein COL154_013867 [Colletotrichum chrysophilum]
MDAGEAEMQGAGLPGEIRGAAVGKDERWKMVLSGAPAAVLPDMQAACKGHPAKAEFLRPAAGEFDEIRRRLRQWQHRRGKPADLAGSPACFHGCFGLDDVPAVRCMKAGAIGQPARAVACCNAQGVARAFDRHVVELCKDGVPVEVEYFQARLCLEGAPFLGADRQVRRLVERIVADGADKRGDEFCQILFRR